MLHTAAATKSPKDALEGIGTSLPLSALTNFDFNLYTAIHLLSATLVVNAKLDDIAIFKDVCG